MNIRIDDDGWHINNLTDVEMADLGAILAWAEGTATRTSPTMFGIVSAWAEHFRTARTTALTAMADSIRAASETVLEHYKRTGQGV